jgi:hypothetical protein
MLNAERVNFKERSILLVSKEVNEKVEMIAGK